MGILYMKVARFGANEERDSLRGMATQPIAVVARGGEGGGREGKGRST